MKNQETRCRICESNTASRKCRICGRDVCELDYAPDVDACIVCRDALCSICRGFLSIGICKYCGRQGCEECLVQISLVEYVCIDCYRRLKSGGVENR